MKVSEISDFIIRQKIQEVFGKEIFDGLNEEEERATIYASLKLMGKTRRELLFQHAIEKANSTEERLIELMDKITKLQ